jgi:hypothetical protein
MSELTNAVYGDNPIIENKISRVTGRRRRRLVKQLEDLVVEVRNYHKTPP